MKKDMRNMKKIVALSSLVLMLGTLSLAGCGKKNNTTDPKTEDKTTQQTSTSPALGGTAPASSSGQKGGLLDEKEMPTPTIVDKGEESGSAVKDKSVSENEKKEKEKENKGAGKTAGSGKKVEVKKDDKVAGKTAGSGKKGVSAKESAEDAKKSAENAEKSAEKAKKSAEESKKAAGN